MLESFFVVMAIAGAVSLAIFILGGLAKLFFGDF